MTTNAEILAELLAFRKALEQLVIRFPGLKHMKCAEILDGQATLISVTTGAFAAQSAVAHILDHDGYSCATRILENIGDTVEREARECFEKIASIHDIDLDRVGPAAFKRAVVLRAVRTGDLITDADLLEAMDEEEEEEDVNTTTRNDILRMIEKAEKQS